LNREGLREFLMTNWSGQIPLEPPVSIIFSDLDHFKNVNDKHGHAVGDSVLQEFSRLVQHEIRSHDRLVRWGGEEFLILCHNTDADQGVGLAEKLRAVIARHTWPQGISITASFGVTMHAADEDLGAMILRADRALYMAKEDGRDCVVAI
jgi:diguanylate cyclase (GGDEF)-like protein